MKSRSAVGLGLVALALAGSAFADEKAPEVSISGRLFLRVDLASQEGAAWTGTMSVASARLSVDLKRGAWRGNVELEAGSGAAKLKDGYLKVDAGHHLSVRAGQFKLPTSAMENESALSLPTIGRGELSNILDGGLSVAGRRVGVQVEWKAKGKTGAVPYARAGVWQGASAGTLDQGFAVDPYLRGGVRLDAGGALELGASAGYRTQFDPRAMGFRHFWTVGADATWERDDCWGGTRAWLEGFAGSSPIDITPMTTADPTFVAARAQVAVRRGGQKKGKTFVEPFARAAVIDPNLDTADDLVWEATAGVNVGQWRRWRLQAQGELRRAGMYTPAALGGLSGAPVDENAVRVQLGAEF